jgi:hypothetical protein
MPPALCYRRAMAVTAASLSRFGAVRWIVVACAVVVGFAGGQAPRSHGQALTPGTSGTSPPGTTNPSGGPAMEGPPGYLQGPGTTLPPTLTPQELQQAEESMRRANRAGPLTPPGPVAPQSPALPASPPPAAFGTWPPGVAAQGPPWAPLVPPARLDTLPPTAGAGPRFLAWGWGPDQSVPPQGPTASPDCSRDVSGDWRVAGRQSSPSANDYATSVSVVQFGSWLIVRQPAENLTYYGVCRGDQLMFDVYSGRQFVGSQDGFLDGREVRLIWAGTTGTGLETWAR